MNIPALPSQKRKEKGVRTPSKSRQGHSVCTFRGTQLSQQQLQDIFLPPVAVLIDKSVLNSLHFNPCSGCQANYFKIVQVNFT